MATQLRELNRTLIVTDVEQSYSLLLLLKHDHSLYACMLQRTCRDTNVALNFNQPYNSCPYGTVFNNALVTPPSNQACCSVSTSSFFILRCLTFVKFLAVIKRQRKIHIFLLEDLQQLQPSNAALAIITTLGALSLLGTLHGWLVKHTSTQLPTMQCVAGPTTCLH
jgi:hypothetical protein